jgi:hypothetical protein
MNVKKPKEIIEDLPDDMEIFAANENLVLAIDNAHSNCFVDCEIVIYDNMEYDEAGFETEEEWEEYKKNTEKCLVFWSTAYC